MVNKTLLIGKRFFTHELVTGSFYIFVGTMISNVLLFLINLFLARSLTYADYAIFASLISVIALASIPAGSINTVIVKFATGYHAKNELGKIKLLYIKFFKFILAFSFSTFLFFVIFASTISSFLRLDNIWYVILVGFILMFFYLNVLNTAFLQSLLKFAFLSFLTSISSFIRLLVCVLLVYLGFRAFGGLWAIFVTSIAAFLIAFYPVRKIIFSHVERDKISVKSGEIFSFAIPTFITLLFLTSFTSIDVILVKHFFNARDAGFYSGLSLIGKVIFYFTSPIPAVMFPLLVKRDTSGRHFNNLFYISLILVFLPSFAITLFYFVEPEFVIKLFLGGRDYLSSAKYLGLFGLFLTVFSLVNVCVSFFLSLNITKITPIVAVASILQIILIFFYHSNFYQVIGVSLFVCTGLLIFLLSYYFKRFVV